MRLSLLSALTFICSALAISHLELADASNNDSMPILPPLAPLTKHRNITKEYNTWTQADDTAILAAVDAARLSGKRPHWTKLSKTMQRSKTSVFCRYANCLQNAHVGKMTPEEISRHKILGRKRKPWTAEEDAFIIEYSRVNKSMRWDQLALLLDRPQSSVNSHYNNLKRDAKTRAGSEEAAEFDEPLTDDATCASLDTTRGPVEPLGAVSSSSTSSLKRKNFESVPPLVMPGLHKLPNSTNSSERAITRYYKKRKQWTDEDDRLILEAHSEASAGSKTAWINLSRLLHRPRSTLRSRRDQIAKALNLADIWIERHAATTTDEPVWTNDEENFDFDFDEEILNAFNDLHPTILDETIPTEQPIEPSSRFIIKHNKIWTEAEDSAILAAVNDARLLGNRPSWKELSKMLQRSRGTIFHHYTLRLQKDHISNMTAEELSLHKIIGLKRRLWTSDEDEFIIEYAKNNNRKRWRQLGVLLNRSESSVYAHFNYLTRHAKIRAAHEDASEFDDYMCEFDEPLIHEATLAYFKMTDTPDEPLEALFPSLTSASSSQEV